MTREFIKRKICQSAIQAVLYEVSTTPKPGLVDRQGQGAHIDMDFFTFMSSTASLYPYFSQCVEVSYKWIDEVRAISNDTESEDEKLNRYELSDEELNYKELNYKKLFSELRQEGLIAEKYMFDATNGVNTHKGVIFTLGILASAMTIVYVKNQNQIVDSESVCNEVQKLTEGILGSDYKNLENKRKHTHGEAVYLNHGLKGVRHEVESGFPTVMNHSLPLLNKLSKDNKLSTNDMLVQVLLLLISKVNDINIVYRRGVETLHVVKSMACEAIHLGGMETDKGKDFIKNMCRDFIEMEISPGGSADLLAVTVMFFLMEGNDL